LKIKAFISQKSLDTPVFRLIRFPQKVLTESKPPLELFSLEEKAAQLPGGLFVSCNVLITERVDDWLAEEQFNGFFVSVIGIL
jgi:hypothetical protein